MKINNQESSSSSIYKISINVKTISEIHASAIRLGVMAS